jgi:hypothetical protein
MDIRATAQLAGHYCWVETQLFEVLGEWLHTVDDAATLVRLGERCTRHGEHADAWRARIAAVPAIDAHGLIVPTPPFADAATALRDSSVPLADRVARYETVAVPALLASYRSTRADIDDLFDGPTARLLDRSIDDLGGPAELPH